MVMRPEPLFAAIDPLRAGGGQVILLDPAGERLTDPLARELAAAGRLILVCGRYEGIDERARGLADREVSIGDYVLTGGELPALVLIDAVGRLVPGVIEAESHEGDSFADGLLEGPHYTRPERFREATVPPVLLSGHHGEVALVRLSAAPHPGATPRPARVGPPDGAGSRGPASPRRGRGPDRLSCLVAPREALLYSAGPRPRVGRVHHVRAGSGAPLSR